MSEQTNDENENQPSPFLKMLGDVRAGLRPGGPEVDEELLCAYVADSLIVTERKIVERYITTWSNWYKAYWELCADLDELAVEEEQQAKVDALTEQEGGEFSTSINPSASIAWLAAPLISPKLSDTTVSKRMLFLATGLATCLSLRMSGKTRSEAGLSQESPSPIEANITEGSPLVFRDKDHWVHMTFEGEVIRIRAGRSPTEAFTRFRVKLYRDQEVLMLVEAENGVATIHSQDLEETAMNTANTLVITSSEV